MAFQRAGAYLDRSSGPWLDRFDGVNWREELRLVSTAILMTIPICLICLWISRTEPAFLLASANWIAARLQSLGDVIEYCMKRTTEPLVNYVKRKLASSFEPIKRITRSLGDNFSRITRPARKWVHGHLHTIITNIYQESLWRQRSFDGTHELSRRHHRMHMGYLHRGPRSTCRFTELFPFLYIWGWPSRGGVIILERATAVDCEFLGLDHLDLRQGRHSNQETEDEICQRLLRLGAKWWDSEYRFRDVEQWCIDSWRRRVPVLKSVLTDKEISQALVGWPSTGGLYLARFDFTYFRIGQFERAHHHPDGPVLIGMARTMDEKCEVLRDQFDAKFYQDAKDLEENTFINSWETKFSGEAGPMMVNRNGIYEAASPGPAWWRPEISEGEEDDEEEMEEEE